MKLGQSPFCFTRLSIPSGKVTAPSLLLFTGDVALAWLMGDSDEAVAK